MRKLLPLLVISILVLGGLGSSALPINNILADFFINENESKNVLLDDELDQSQTNYDEECPGILGYYPINPSWNMSAAQSFKPTKEILTRVFIYAGKNATTSYPLILAIREHLTGENLAVASVNPDEFMVFPNLSWIEFDFDDIILNIDTIYYIVGYTSNVTDNTYIGGASCFDVYPNGTAHTSVDGGETWETYPDADACFMTYGIDSKPPDAPIINGKTNGKPGKQYEYTFNATDPDGDDVKYYINWGDNTTYETDFNASGTEVMVKHTWAEEGTYNITAKAQDIHGFEGPDGTLEVTMPRTRTVNRPLLLRLFERFPMLEKLLELIIFD